MNLLLFLHIKNFFTQNIFMLAVWLFVIGNFILIMPIYLNIYCMIDSICKKMYFGISIFGVMIIGGYFTSKGATIYIHLSKNKAFALNLEDFILKGRKNLNFKGFQIYNISCHIRCGVSNFNLLNILFGLTTINQEVAPIFCAKYPYLKVKNILFVDEKEGITAIFKLGVFFNILTLVNLFINAIIKRMVKNVKRKKQRSKGC